MEYIIKANAMYAHDRSEPILKVKGVMGSTEKQLRLNGKNVGSVKIRQFPAPAARAADVRFREYVLLEPDETELLRAKPEYAEGEDPLEAGWPVFRMPEVDRASVRICCDQYVLCKKDAAHYDLRDAVGNAAVKITHRGLSGGWNIEAIVPFGPIILCGLYVFCRYMEQENELIFV